MSRQGSVQLKPLHQKIGQTLGFVLAITTGVGGGLTVLQWRSLQQAPVPVTADIPSEPTVVVALGRIEPEGEVINVAGLTGEKVKELFVEEGDVVEKGSVLAHLDAYNERLAERNYAESQLIEARNQLRAETRFGQAQIQEARTRLQQVDRPQSLQIQAQQDAVDQARAQLDLAEINLTRYQNLYQQGAIPRIQLDEQMTKVRDAQETLSRAQTTMAQYIAQQNTAVNNAIAQVGSAQTNLARSQLQTQVEVAARNLQLAEERLERTIIRSPRQGQVLNVITDPGETISDQGILQMGDTRQMYVIAEVDEANIGLVAVGQRATISDRNGTLETPLTGQVDRIGRQVLRNQALDSDPTANVDRRIIEVRIRLDQSNAVAALTNLQVDAEIQVREPVHSPEQEVNRTDNTVP
ncbi:HlyD family efflux transporter periplasmic adaptor subunit [Oscillatoria sp. FACHB-1407]|uniref:HlyD family efflux transporter periplasmic adaptor subunit n=1 Tax=Oscillatoria sp. FACHB-1407 TaxID=2692847 RepID=UPI001685AD60|nr:HlyD family efflux transporter periplasmic adaptor subunit [Oscillatoria sp. FACHB-1407]MBD2463108.1 HlyD family efflux transporter periplasmic adaptor subunit [Oscillatoria sp. FACHB-1407]